MLPSEIQSGNIYEIVSLKIVFFRTFEAVNEISGKTNNFYLTPNVQYFHINIIYNKYYS